MRRHFELLALFALVIFIVAMTTITRREDFDDSQNAPNRVIRSSYRTLPDGYKGLYLTLEELRYPVHRQIRPYSLLPKHGLLIIADPHKQNITPYELRRLRSWLQQGNMAIILLEHHPDCFSPNDNVNMQPQADDEDDPSAVPLAHASPADTTTATAVNGGGSLDPHVAPVLHSVPSLTVQSTKRLSSRRNGMPSQQMLDLHDLPPALQSDIQTARPLYADERGVVMAYSPIASGGIVWCSSPWSFSNAGLPEGKNLDLLLALADRRPGGPIIFDEYHQGYGAGMTVWNIAPALTKLGVGQIVLALVLLLLTLSWRFGASRLPAEERFARSRAEYLMSMATLLQRARATQLVRDRLNTMFRRELSRRLGVPMSASLEQFEAANAVHQVVSPEALAQVWQQFDQLEYQQRPRPEVVFRLAQQVHRLLHHKK